MLSTPVPGARAFPTGYARQLLVPEPEDGSPRPFAAVTLVTLEHESGRSLSGTRVHWEFGCGPTHNQFGSCIDVGKQWTREEFDNLRGKHSLYQSDLLDSTHVRVEAWAHPDLLGYALDALLTNNNETMFDAKRLRVFTVGMGIAPHVNEAMPLDPAQWRTHPAVVAGAVRCS